MVKTTLGPRIILVGTWLMTLLLMNNTFDAQGQTTPTPRPWEDEVPVGGPNQGPADADLYTSTPTPAPTSTTGNPISDVLRNPVVLAAIATGLVAIVVVLFTRSAKKKQEVQDFPWEPPHLGGSEKQPTAQSFKWMNIRTLLNEGFSDIELRQLIFDVPIFRPVHNQLAQNTAKTQIVQQLLEYAYQNELIDILLKEVKERNPTRYERHQPYHVATAGSPISSGIHGKSKRAKRE